VGVVLETDIERVITYVEIEDVLSFGFLRGGGKAGQSEHHVIYESNPGRAFVPKTN
jgi:hypothetical protein